MMALLKPPLVPAAVSVQAVALAEPPLSFLTFLMSVSLGALSSLEIEQVTSPPRSILTLLPALWPPLPVHDQARSEEHTSELESLRQHVSRAVLVIWPVLALEC